MKISTNFKNVSKVYYDAEKEEIEGQVHGHEFTMNTSNLDIPFPQIAKKYQDVVFGAIEKRVLTFMGGGCNEGELYAEIEYGVDENGEPIIIELRGWFE